MNVKFCCKHLEEIIQMLKENEVFIFKSLKDYTLNIMEYVDESFFRVKGGV